MNDFTPPNVNFDAEQLLLRASEETQLNDFGDDSFRKPMEVLLNALEGEAGLTHLGRFLQYERVLNTLKNRLRLSEWVRRHPEILSEEIASPVVIVGLPRTGTTMLHRVLASDKRFHAPLWYEVRNPAPFMDWDPQQKDQRLTLAEQEVAALLEANPEIAAIHPMDPLGADEDILLLEHSFYSTVPAAFCNVPSYSDWLFSNNNLPGYAYLKLQLQALQWQKKRSSGDASDKRWLLKTPHHLHFVDALLATFPDAQILSTHRDPIDTIPSISSFNYNLWVTQADNVDASVVGAQWSAMFARGMLHTMKVREHHSTQFMDLGFKSVLKDPENATERIYQFIGMALTEEARAAMQLHRDENRRDARPAHEYSLADFGFSEAGIQAQFSTYRKAFSDYI